jgi:AraC-like DNA-binding protein
MLSKTPRPLDLEDPRGDVLADVLGATLLRNAIYKRLECGAPWGIRVPAHDRATFYLVARGNARFEVGRDVRELSAGDALFIPHGAAHVVRDSRDTVPVGVCDGKQRAGTAGHGAVRRLGGRGAPTTLVAGFFQFSGRKPTLLAGMPDVVPLTATDPTQHRWIAATLQLLVAECAAPGPASTIVLQRLADVLFVQTLRTLAAHGDCKQHGLAALADPAIHEALALIHRDVARDWTVAELAKLVGLSRSAFAARFTELVGEPPLQYLARWRMARAAELLRETNERIQAIAVDVGYESVPSFNKAFRKWQGTSPTSFRKLATGA